MFTLVTPPESPCGCGSGKEFGNCHLQNGKIEIFPKNINPPPPQTYKSFKKCYFSFTNDCDGGMSGEHVVSKAVLRHISDKEIIIEGGNFSRKVSINSDSLKTKRLCRRHNTAVSPIDAEAGRLMKAVQQVVLMLAGEVDAIQRLYFFNQFDIERWLLKTLLNVYHSRQSISPQKFVLPPQTMSLFYSSLTPPFGLYIPVKESNGEMFKMKIAREAAVNLITEGNQVTGISISLSGLELKFLIAGHPQTVLDFQMSHSYRPKFINFFQGQEVGSIAIVGTHGDKPEIWISRGDPNASIPSDMIK